MSLITRMRRQYAVYWNLVGYDVNNKPIYDDPVEIRCRWDDREERDVNVLGEEIDVRATVYVDREVTLGGVLWQGLLVDAPNTPPEHGRIKVIRRHPNLRNTQTLRIARL